jgi:hypothetical protein
VSAVDLIGCDGGHPGYNDALGSILTGGVGCKTTVDAVEESRVLLVPGEFGSDISA